MFINEKLKLQKHSKGEQSTHYYLHVQYDPGLCRINEMRKTQ